MAADLAASHPHFARFILLISSLLYTILIKKAIHSLSIMISNLISKLLVRHAHSLAAD
jgi:hypothetical protein